MDGVSILEQSEQEQTTAPGNSEDLDRAATGGSEQVNVSDVLGHDAGVAPLPRYRAPLERLAGRARSGLAVLARPRVAGVLVFGLGILIVLLLGYIYLFTPLSAERAQHALLQRLTVDEVGSYGLAQGHTPPEGSPVALLEIPSLHLFDAVVQGSSAQDLRNGPGHMPTTALPGEPGNAVIAGRRATFGAPFAAIGSLKKGQLIKVVDGLGTYRYTVTGVVSAVGGRHDVVTETATNRLTLVTAASGIFPQGRLAVIAQLDGKPLADTTEPRFHVAASELGLNDDPASAFLAVLWCVAFFALLSGAAWLLRHWHQPVVVYVLAVPLLLLFALFACESIIGFLPATV